MKPRLIVALALVAVLNMLGSFAQAEVLRVVVVKAQDTAGYMKEIDRGRGLLKKAGSPATLRVWRAQYAGTDAGAVVVSVEYPDFVALARDTEKMSSDPELRAWLAGLDKLRTIVSDSIYSELK